MTNFKDMKYERPNFEELLKKGLELTEKIKNADSFEESLKSYMEIDKMGSYVATMGSLCTVRHTINTKDEFYKAENDILDEKMPMLQEVMANTARAVVEGKYKEDYKNKFGKHLIEKYEISLKTFKPEIVEDLIEENKLSTEYEVLIASAEIEFDGNTYNLAGLGPFQQSKDRETRRRANDASWGWLAQNQDKLDEIYDKLVKVRTRIGKKLGFDNFIPVAYARMGRTDWDMEDARVYRKQIAESVVPFAQELYLEQSKRLGIEDMKNFDYNLEFLSGNPKPLGDESYLVPKALKMYRELSAETGEFFQMMVDNELMDLTTKPGKRGGGYMTSFPDYGAPFIFSNFNGTSGDVDVLTHEAGHAFNGYLQKDVSPRDLMDMTMEVAEIHSMSMEFFTHPWMSEFFGEDTEKYYYAHVCDAIKFLPYGSSVDEFQEWVYLNPDKTPEERRAKYRELEHKYLPHLDYNGFEYLENGGRWQKQAHIYSMPFYYLDYTLAQVCAFQYFVWDMENHKEAWESYLNCSRRAGFVPFKELLKECNLKSPFEAGCIDSVLPGLKKFLSSLDMDKTK
ncbi:MAG: M3 family oligoendopeptidase [Eubacteriales bacterium]|nr:M3 family oligoendopeptidase [Eubacteriales bacterium]